MIELTPEQAAALRTPNGKPLRLVDPQTQEMYVLVPLTEYGQLREEYDDSPWTDEEMDSLRAEACEMLDSFGKKP
jgi:hypothetical protein